MENLDARFWTAKYKNQETGWDLGQVSPPLKAYFDQLKDKGLKILIPGGGNSYEAEYLHAQGFKNVYVADLSETPLLNLKRRVPTFPDHHLLHTDFFELKDRFDLIIEQTFFCALNPSLRPKYVKEMSQLLKPSRHLVGLLFDATLNNDKPPFGGNQQEYKVLFSKHFNLEIMEPCHNSIKPRLGSELFIKLSPK